MTLKAGRPKGDSDARTRLIAAALTLFSSQAFQNVSTRQLAREAGVDAAMIRYYFGSKLGLFEQMVRETLEPVRAKFRAQSLQPSPTALAELMKIYYGIMAPNPGLPRLIVRVLQEGEGTAPFKVMFSVFSEIMVLSRQWLGRALKETGRIRPDVDPELVRLSIASLMVFPLIAPPVLMRQFGVKMEGPFLDTLIQHNVRLLEQGLLLGADENNQRTR
ncbi:TetR/AcrR family transcriptional regulator [Gallaecimonas kandeliae]|uniref:TetR/AcrR family transcriptional regulator n=1 Tax=Gallaecimonas kandeliae TaxID=3029055 RepID=UPI00264768F0|nr:TetR/AcrR family transcriptional regulator [Gallaecimonas kandeliae]WKE67355.1 TetR/AcrR family transcriptional regulator [Gallaecimonas kandeliae]